MGYVNDLFSSGSVIDSINATDFAQAVPTVNQDIAGITGLGGFLGDGNLTSAIPNLSSFGNAASVRELVPGFGGEAPGTDAPVSGSGADMRVRLRAQDNMANQVYGPMDEKGISNVLGILHSTNGMMFPYTPTIDWAQSVDYSSLSLTHSNQGFESYKGTPSTNLTVSGDFTVQNHREAQYMIAVIHFLRVVSKMYFGKQNPGYPTGMPPPVLIFSGYGDFMFNDLPVIVKSHGFNLGKDVSYIDFKIAGGTVRLPSLLSISVSLTVQQTPKKLREEFNLDKFRTGELMTKKKGWI